MWHRTDEMCSIRRFKSNILPLLNILHRLFPTRSNVKLLQTFGLFQWFFFYYAAAEDFHNCFVWMNKGKLSVSIDGKSKASDTWRFLDIYNSIVRYIVYGYILSRKSKSNCMHDWQSSHGKRKTACQIFHQKTVECKIRIKKW